MLCNFQRELSTTLEAEGRKRRELYATLINVDMQKMIFQRTTQRVRRRGDGGGCRGGNTQIYFAYSLFIAFASVLWLS